ncbi:MAG: hypothetical protein V4662_05190 [Verrucomicrobiota bacterium]
MPSTKLTIKPERSFTWEQWQARRAERRRVGNLVAPPVIRRKKSDGDEYLRETYEGERGPRFNMAFDPAADEYQK